MQVGFWLTHSMSIYSLYSWLLLLLLSLLFLVKRKMLNGRDNKHLPPGPPKLPIIGNLHQLGGYPHRSLCELAKRYGPVMLLQLGSVPVVVISSAEAAEEALKIHDLRCCSRPSSSAIKKISYNFSDMTYSPYGDYWRRIRKLCVVELLSIRRVQSFRSIREEEVASLINSIHQSSSSSATPVNLTEKLTAPIANIVFRMAFGTTFGATNFTKERLTRLVEDALELLGSFSADDYFRYVGWIIDRITGFQARTERVFQEMDAFYQQIIDDHLKLDRAADKGHEDFVDVLVRIMREQAGVDFIQLTKENIKGVLKDMFLAGISTSSDTLIWAMAELARTPRVMKKAQEEVRNTIGNKGRVTEADIDDLHYLKMIIKETLRLHPAAPLLLPRQAIAEFKINGYEIRPKMLIQVNIWAIGRDPKYWKNPEEFIPERFEDSSIDFEGQNFEFLPFGAGRRNCPGQYMGTVVLGLVLANLLYYFDWKIPDDVKHINMEEKDGPAITLPKLEPLKLVPVSYLQHVGC